MTSPFKTSADASGTGPKVTDFEGALCIFTYIGEGEKDTKAYGTKPYVEVDIDCVQGVPNGTKSKMQKQGSYPPEFPTLSDLTGTSVKKVLVFQGYLRGSFRGREPGDLVLGRINVMGMLSSVSVNEKDKKASFVLDEPTQADTDLAVKWLNDKQAKRLGKQTVPDREIQALLDNSEPDF